MLSSVQLVFQGPLIKKNVAFYTISKHMNASYVGARRNAQKRNFLLLKRQFNNCLGYASAIELSRHNKTRYI